MKTSNKIILGIFLFPFLLVLLMNIALYAKIKSGSYTTREQEIEENTITTPMQNFSDIDLTAIKNGRIEIKQGDGFAIRFEKWAKDNFEYEQQGNKLVLKSKKGRENEYKVVTVLCPSFSHLSADSIEVFVDAMQLGNTQIEVGAEANLNFAAHAQNLTLSGKKNSNISFQEGAIADTLNLQLVNGANFNKTAGIVKQIGQVNLEDSAALNIDGKTMRTLLQKQSQQ